MDMKFVLPGWSFIHKKLTLQLKEFFDLVLRVVLVMFYDWKVLMRKRFTNEQLLVKVHHFNSMFKLRICIISTIKQEVWKCRKSIISPFFLRLVEPPKNHLNENLKRIRRIMRETQKRQEVKSQSAQPVPVKALWQSQQYNNIQSKVKQKLEEVGHYYKFKWSNEMFD